MSVRLLILGGTTEASALARAVDDAGIAATFSYAGRVETPKEQPLPTRVGGFGGVDGLFRYLRDNAITHVVDATHPFAAQMSTNAADACNALSIPFAALTRPAWEETEGDRWTHVQSIADAVDALAGDPKRVMLALGRMHVEDFAAQPQHHYVLRLVDQPSTSLKLPHQTVTVARGPFDIASDIALFQDNRVDIVVCKNAGGNGAVAKLHAARALGLPVIVIDRPALPKRLEFGSTDAVMKWLNQAS